MHLDTLYPLTGNIGDIIERSRNFLQKSLKPASLDSSRYKLKRNIKYKSENYLKNTGLQANHLHFRLSDRSWSLSGVLCICTPLDSALTNRDSASEVNVSTGSQRTKHVRKGVLKISASVCDSGINSRNGPINAQRYPCGRDDDRLQYVRTAQCLSHLSHSSSMLDSRFAETAVSTSLSRSAKTMRAGFSRRGLTPL